MNKVRRKILGEDGYLIIEATIVFPIMFFIIFFLLYMGNFFFLKAKIDSVVSQEAIRYASYFADPNLEEIMKTGKVATSASEKTTEGLYRYINPFGKEEADDTEKAKLRKEIEDTGFFTDMTPAAVTIDAHKVHNYIIYQTYEVAVTYQLKFPIKFIFQDDYWKIDMSARDIVPITDTSEFIRNTDFAVDIFERTNAGNKAAEFYSKYYHKVSDWLEGKKD